ncbi:MAG: hypothetical protein IKU37_08585 [Candidatus Gastranaerophilales bacterium]|nr:hypothetical protein [Candidatus Gastranaerophilales bacterium]
MYILQTTQKTQLYKTTVCANECKSFSSSYDTVSFTGHFRFEKMPKKSGILRLIHETAFFRDIQTKNFVREYIFENFSNKPDVKMVVGACSSGEEVFTYSMLLDSLKSRLSILGFDISEKIIEQADTGKLLMENSSSLGDSFLCFASKKPLTSEQLEQKKLFDEFFEVTPEVYCEQESLFLKAKRWCTENIFRIPMPKYDGKIIKARNGKFENCIFQVGDILNLSGVTGGKKADVITFSNAMYHLTTVNSCVRMQRIPKKNLDEIVRTIAKNVKENLNPGGIFVLGEEEALQMPNIDIVGEVFKEFGFEPLNRTSEHMENVWRLSK